MLKLGKNTLVEFLKIDDVIFNSKVWRHNRHSDVVTTQEGKSLHGFFVFGCIKVKFGVSGNLWAFDLKS